MTRPIESEYPQTHYDIGFNSEFEEVEAWAMDIASGRNPEPVSFNEEVLMIRTSALTYVLNTTGGQQIHLSPDELFRRRDRLSCATCGGLGIIGGHTGQTPEQYEEVTEDCPDCI